MIKLLLIQNKSIHHDFDSILDPTCYITSSVNVGDLPTLTLIDDIILLIEQDSLDNTVNIINLCFTKKCAGLIVIGSNFEINKIHSYIKAGANYYLNSKTDLAILCPYIERLTKTINYSKWILDTKRFTLTNPENLYLKLGQIDCLLLCILIKNKGIFCSPELFDDVLQLQKSINPKSKLYTRMFRLKNKLFSFDNRLEVVNNYNEGYMLRKLSIKLI